MHNKPSGQQGIIGIILVSFFGLIFLLATVATAVYMFIAQPHKVAGNAMHPSFKHGEYFITDKLNYRSHSPQRGDVIVFKNPLDRSQDFIKRIIAIPGDKLKIEANKVNLNGSELKEDYLAPGTETYPGTFLKDGREFIIPQDSYIVMGDNRSHSSDSREWGYIYRKDLIGKFWFKY